MPDFSHWIVNHGSVTSTGSENENVMFASRATSTSPSAGLVEVTLGPTSAIRGVMLKSSTASPSSELKTLTSSQRTQTVAPGAISAVLMAPESAVRLAAALPFSAAAPGSVIGLVKSRPLTLTQVAASSPRPVAVRLYWKSRRSGPRGGVPTLPDAPRRHCSPV